MRIPGDDRKGRDTRYFVAAEEGARLLDEAGPLVEQAVGVAWYDRHGTDVDRAALALCRLRRTRAGEKGGPEYGDEAVRVVLEGVSPSALVWIASRAISYLDESGFPEAVEPWFPEDAGGV